MRTNLDQSLNQSLDSRGQSLVVHTLGSVRRIWTSKLLRISAVRHENNPSNIEHDHVTVGGENLLHVATDFSRSAIRHRIDMQWWQRVDALFKGHLHGAALSVD